MLYYETIKNIANSLEWIHIHHNHILEQNNHSKMKTLMQLYFHQSKLNISFLEVLSLELDNLFVICSIHFSILGFSTLYFCSIVSVDPRSFCKASSF